MLIGGSWLMVQHMRQLQQQTMSPNRFRGSYPSTVSNTGQGRYSGDNWAATGKTDDEFLSNLRRENGPVWDSDEGRKRSILQDERNHRSSELPLRQRTGRATSLTPSQEHALNSAEACVQRRRMSQECSGAGVRWMQPSAEALGRMQSHTDAAIQEEPRGHGTALHDDLDPFDDRQSIWDIPPEILKSLRENKGSSKSLDVAGSEEEHKSVASRLNSLIDKTSRVEVSSIEGFIEQLNIGEKIGGGAFGQVFLCIWEGVRAAVKLIDIAVDPNMKMNSIETFVKEAEVAAMLRHPNIAQVFKVNVETSQNTNDGHVKSHFRGAIVMEYCEMGSLAEAIKSNLFTVSQAASSSQLVDLQVILKIAEDIARGMLFLHRQDILHADLKPNNVLLKQTNDGVQAKLTDFGLSVQMSCSQTHVSQHQTGTVDHMAPEVMTEGKSSKRSDVYAFGILLWELFCYSRPYLGMRDVAIVHRVVEDDLRPVFPKTAPREYVELATSCWDKDPMKRPSFEQILHQVEQMNQILQKLLSKPENQILHPDDE
eukprot:CAMPEP_0177596840 /NCGR_PEP_ID=MMETSP0419_2-20121207/11358_1 /TAXON_ID=582737 /ORGANISM="Tetraselmis sp., Strain GSL018" /LENGTH=539 /DNA_ID=CAMNT_0019088901 /DNA_START=352 /DNA_END=1971 /DNA_ORIENTATION=-